MREILFRGKDKYTKEWRFGGIVHQTDFYGDKCDKYFIIDGTDTRDYDIGHEYEVIPETVSEYAGLKDKNDVRIFEGDICKFTNWKTLVDINAAHDEVFERIGFIRFNKADFNFVVDHDIESDLKLEIEYNDTIFEVIGNIFDNKELLK